ncbi:MAG TPA: 8-oxoguanine deaminase [Actinomycetota bacterium]|jgi:cytosine/adenosine deaminase-related metal-dependent hydrolase
MTSLLIDSCEFVVTMDDDGTEISGGSILIQDGQIAWVGSGRPPDVEGADVVDGRGTVALPGLINTHHHLYQTLTRVRAVQEGLFGWLTELYPVWAGVDAEWERAAAGVGLAELALSGCSLTTDHHYVFPAGAEGLLEAEIDAAREIGLRFHPCRGSMDLGTSAGGLPPDDVCQDGDTILDHTQAVVRRFHDPSPGSMLRVAIAPCSPFSATQQLMEDSANLARALGVRLHTHIAETLDETAFCQDRFGVRPVELLDGWGWLGPDVWLAHCVHLAEKDIRRIADTGTGVAWCPSSNLRLGSGIAPARALLDETATVGLGVDGSASNDAGNLLAEVRQGMLVSRAGGNPKAMTAREALRVATRGGAACLGWDDLGSLEAGKRADVAMFAVDGLHFAGAEADLVAALVHCAPQRVRHLLVEGRPVVRDGQLVNADEKAIAAEGRRVGRVIAS